MSTEQASKRTKLGHDESGGDGGGGGGSSSKNNEEGETMTYISPADAERREMMKLAELPDGFDRIFHSEVASQAPEHAKWWKDDWSVVSASIKDVDTRRVNIIQDLSLRLQRNRDIVCFFLDAYNDFLVNEAEAHGLVDTVENGGRYHPKSLDMLTFCDSSLFDDADFFLKHLVRRFPGNLFNEAIFSEIVGRFASLRLRSDLAFVRGVVSKLKECPHLVSAFIKLQVPHHLKDDGAFMEKLVYMYCATTTDMVRGRVVCVRSTANIGVFRGGLEHLSERLRDDGNFLLKVQKKIALYEDVDKFCDGNHVVDVASETLLHDKEFILSILPYHKYPSVIVENASAEWRDDKNFMISAVEATTSVRNVWTRDCKKHELEDILESCTYSMVELSSQRLLDDAAYLLGMYDKNPGVTARMTYNVASERLQEDKNFVMNLINDYEGSQYIFYKLPPSLKDDDDVFRTAVVAYTEFVGNRYPNDDGDYPLPLSPLQHASARLIDDDQLVRMSVGAYSYNLTIASDRIKASQEHVLFALESWKDNPYSVLPRDITEEVPPDIFSDRFTRQAIPFCPFVLRHTNAWVCEDLYSLVSIALGGNSKNGTNHQFWRQFHGSQDFRRHLIKFWRDEESCMLARIHLSDLCYKMTSLGGDSLVPILKGGGNAKKETRDGFVVRFGVKSFCTDSWARPLWERVWLLSQIGTIQRTKEMQRDIKEGDKKINISACIERIAQFAGYAQILKLTSQLRMFQPLLNTLLEQKLEHDDFDKEYVLPVEDDSLSDDSDDDSNDDSDDDSNDDSNAESDH